MRRAAAIIVSALLLLTAACGSDDDETATDDGVEAAVTTPTADDGTEGETSSDGDPDDGDGTDADEAGAPEGGDDGPSDDDGDEASDDGGGIAMDASSLCEDLAVEDVAAASAMAVVESERAFGAALEGDLEFTTAGCSYATADGEGEVTVREVQDLEGGAEAFYAALLQTSAESMMDDYPHQVVEGLGDGAFFKAGLRSGDLVVLHAEGVLVVEGEAPDGEQLGQPEMQAVAEAALAALG